MNRNFSNLKVILMEPNGPINVGSIARLCANFEINELIIVSPKCDIYSQEARRMALKGNRYLDKCNIFNTLEQAISDCDLVLASCGRVDLNKDFVCESPEDISKWISSFDKIKTIAVLFGREDRGLSNRDLLFAHKIINIQTSRYYPSLNLSHAVSIILYELNKCSSKKVSKEVSNFNLASSEQINDSFLEIEDMLLKVGYLLKHTSSAKISKFKKYIYKAETSTHEIGVLRGIVHQINWFLNNKKGG